MRKLHGQSPSRPHMSVGICTHPLPRCFGSKGKGKPPSLSQSLTLAGPRSKIPLSRPPSSTVRRGAATAYRALFCMREQARHETCTAVVEQLACGYYHSVALSESGEVFAFGRNDYGQLGLGHRESTW